jgi:hypothetical protein
MEIKLFTFLAIIILFSSCIVVTPMLTYRAAYLSNYNSNYSRNTFFLNPGYTQIKKSYKHERKRNG